MLFGASSSVIVVRSFSLKNLNHSYDFSSSLILMGFIQIVKIVIVHISIYLLFGLVIFAVNENLSNAFYVVRYKEYQLQDYHSWFLKQVCTNQSIKFLNFLEGRPRVLLSLPLQFGQLEEDFIFR